MSEQVNSYRWGMLLLMWLAGLAITMPFFAYPPLLPEIAIDLKLSDIEATLLMSFTTLTFTSFQLIGGIGADRFGTKKTVAIGLATLSVSTLLCATANSSILESVARLIMGVGVGLTGVNFIKVLSDWFSRRDLSLAMGLQATSWPAGSAVGLLFPVMLKQFLDTGWRVPIYVFGLFGCVTTIAFLIMGKENAPLLSRSNIRKTVLNLLKLRDFWLLATAQLGFIACNTAIVTWLPIALMELGWTYEVATLASALLVLIGIPASLIGGVISSRIGKQKPVLLLSGAAMGLSTALLGFVLSGPLLWPVVCVLGWFTHFRLGPFFAACSLLPEVGAEKVGTMVGLIMLLSSVGGFFSPIIMGLLRNSTGTHIAGLFVVAGFAIPSVLHGVFGQEAIVKA